MAEKWPDAQIEYSVHGIGCRFQTAEGHVVDLDVDPSGRAVWDAWRLAQYAETLGEDLDQVEALRALRDGCERAVLAEARPGWFTFWPSAGHVP